MGKCNISTVVLGGRTLDLTRPSLPLPWIRIPQDQNRTDVTENVCDLPEEASENECLLLSFDATAFPGSPPSRSRVLGPWNISKVHKPYGEVQSWRIRGRDSASEFGLRF